METTSPWYWALYYANKIRAAINLNFDDAYGRSSCQQLIVPSNTGNSVSSTISSSATLQYYGHICQGTSPGTTSSCSCGGIFYYLPQNILNTSTANTEVLHPVGLTAAMTTSNSWYSTYKNKFVKVTNLADTSKSIVVRITDSGPAGQGIELTDRAYRTVGASSGSNKVKIELMST